MTRTKDSIKDCKFFFKDLQVLSAHYLDKHQVDFTNPFVCNECDMDFIFEEALFNHQKIQHSIELSNFKCDDCRLEFFSIGTKSIHDDLYHNKIISKLFTCKFCLYATVSSRDYFNHHQENHTSMYEFITFFHQYWIYELFSRNFFSCFLKADNFVFRYIYVFLCIFISIESFSTS